MTINDLSVRGDREEGRPAVSFVLPAFNEEENIVSAIAETVKAAERSCSVYEVIVVDDGSGDRTAELVRDEAERNPAVRLVSHEFNKGYGQALRTGFTAARLDFVFFTDSDNQFDMEELPLLLHWTDRCDVVAGYRKVRNDPPVRKLNAWCWNRLVRFLFCVPVRDVDCAFKVFRRSALSGLDIQSRGAMINTEIMVKLARSGSSVVEVGVTHLPRTAGTPQGAKPRVVLRALMEVMVMYPELTRLSARAPRGVPSNPTANGRAVDHEAGDGGRSEPDDDHRGASASRDGVAQVA
jgi:hypothetical protein